MVRLAAVLALALCTGWTAPASEEPEGLLDRFLVHMRAELDNVPDYVCTQVTERLVRSTSEQSWSRMDTWRFEVALAGGQELYALPGAARFDDRPLSHMVGRGTISTGKLGLLARNVFSLPQRHFEYRGQAERDGRAAHEFAYDAPPAQSGFRVRHGTEEAVVAFQGAFWIDAETLDLLRLEIQAYDIPESVALAEADTILTYRRLEVGVTEPLLPVAATLAITTADGLESLNRSRFGGCRQFTTESAIRFDTESKSEGAPAEASDDDYGLPKGTLVQVELDGGLDLAKAQIGDPVRARVARPVKDGNTVLVEQGAAVLGNLVRLEQVALPYPMYEIGLEFHTLEAGGSPVRVPMTLYEAGPAAGLLRQARRLDPTFDKKRKARMEILVREVQQRQGILHWDARRATLPPGLRMTWKVLP
ncbi:MAG: hypothetical protein IPM24_23935 [Bryobacterales bacterium]|nr:hypothetical protein [Bryobacterales bacterium]